MPSPLGTTGENLLRDLAPRVLAVVIRRFGDFAAAEDAVQEALLAATIQWPRAGIPDNPRAWLTHVATRRMQDHVRSELARRLREANVIHAQPSDWCVAPAADSALEADEDDTLLLLFMCCHPALTRSSAIALTLRAVGGLTTAEVATAYMVPEATMAQRISRAKQLIRGSGIPFQMPTDRERSERLRSVLHVLYLMFNEGYATSSVGLKLQRTDLSNEAIRLMRIVHSKTPEDAEVGGLLALMLLTDARRLARTGPDGELIPLAEQDRGVWDRQLIAEGNLLITEVLSRGAVGPYQLQAAIQALHNEAARPEDTDWPQILALYSLLKRMSDNPMVALNYAVAVAMVHGPTVALRLLAPLDADKRIGNHHRLPAVRAHLYEMDGDHAAAIAHYLVAANRTRSIPERDYLLRQVTRLSALAE